MRTPSSKAIRSRLYALLLGAVACAPTPDSGHDVVQAMIRRHRGNWHESLTFVQRTIKPRVDGGADTALWYEAVKPGKLRIDIAPLASRNGVLYVDGIRYQFANGALVDQRPDVNPLLLLLNDVFFLPQDRSTTLLDSLGVDLDALSETVWQGRSTYVVGADTGDTTTAQFWVDKDRLLPVRLIQRLGPEQALLDAHIGGYRRVDGHWVESEILIHVNGGLYQREEYTDVRVNVPVADELFDPGRWASGGPLRIP